MNFKRLSTAMSFLLMITIVFTSCKDEKKETEMKRMETEKVEMENAKKAEMEQMEMKKKEEAMMMEAREKSIAGMAMQNENLSMLVTDLKAADLATMLSEPGNYTVFAPSNNAFEKLPQAKRDALMLPENKEMLKNVLQYHVVQGKITSDQLAAAIKGANGSYKFKTVTGDELTASMKGDQFIITDGRGKKAQVILGNQEASNGIVHVIDAVLMAKK
ncbi:MAG: fasciclin domain-containing protein [Aquaticitalea sp.]